MKRFGFFNSINGDRKYLASDISNAFNIALGSGLQPIKDCFKIVPHQNMKLKMKPGGAMIYGCYIFDEEDEVIELGTAHSELNRIDRIVLRYDKFERSVKTVVIKGTPALSPTPPATLRTDNQFDLVLADITVGKAVTEIKQENITDMRSSMLCGFLGMKMTPEIEKQLESKADKSIYGDDGGLGVDRLTASSWVLYRNNTSKGVTFKNRLTDMNLTLFDDGTIYYNDKQLLQMKYSSELDTPSWKIARDEGNKKVHIWNKTGNTLLALYDNGKLTYGGSSIPVVQIPAFEQSVSLGRNQTVTVTHNLGYKTLVEVGTTLGNVMVTWQHIDNNTIRLYNYSTGNDATAFIRCW